MRNSIHWRLFETSEIEWDDILKGFCSVPVYYTRDYAKLEETYRERVVLLYAYSAEWKLIEVFSLRPINTFLQDNKIHAKSNQFDLTSIYGYGGPLFAGSPSYEDFDDLWRSVSRRYRLNNYFVRMNPVVSLNTVVERFYQGTTIGENIVVPLSSLDSAVSNMTGTCRNRIRKAQKLDIKIFRGTEDWMKDSFLWLYHDSMTRKRADPFYYFCSDYFEGFERYLRGRYFYEVAMWKGKCLSAALFLFDDISVHYHLAASDANYMRYPASNLIIYEAMKWGVQTQKEQLVLGSGYGGRNDDSLFHFKRGFHKNGNLPFMIGRKVFDEDEYDFLCNAVGVNDSGFFPAYRKVERRK